MTHKKQTTRKKAQRQAVLHRHVKHAVVPHKDNQYRPHLIRWQGVTVVLALIVVLQLVYGLATNGGVLGRVSNIDTTQLLDDTNSARVEAGLPELRESDALGRAAVLKGQDMIENNYWAHTSPTGVTPWKWLGDVGYEYAQAGENLAKNYPTAESTVDAWMASETHRANILNSAYSEVGFAVVDGILDGRDATVVVAYYGAPPSSAVVAGEAEVTPTVFAAPVAESATSPLAYFGSALQSLSPATIGALGLLVILSVVALVAHHYRQKLPVAWRKSWKVHHGMYTFVGALGLAVLLVWATGGGQL
ncbi:hypothetical protein CL689_00730 [Candidatus Saccharibacteria bacterium]|nr:hypothetical protein [Candidatus Saccharibacteria bacterium]MBQ68575.1 hypothetical protein [Candidatus Saccharibacteria bacterium]